MIPKLGVLVPNKSPHRASDYLLGLAAPSPHIESNAGELKH